MPVTIDVNGLTMSHKGSSGFEKCSAPDVCMTPASPSPIPVPYTIISFNTGLIRGSKTVKADGGNSIDIRGSAHTPCTGDEAGTLGGVISGTNVLYGVTLVVFTGCSKIQIFYIIKNISCIHGMNGRQ